MRRDSFDRSFTIMTWMVRTFFVVTLVCVLGFLGMYMYLLFKAGTLLQDECKDGVAKCMGRAVKEFNDAKDSK